MTHMFTSPSAMQVKNQPKTTGILEKLDIINRLEKREQVDIRHNVSFVCISINTICDDNAVRITESAMLGTATVLLE